VRIMTNSEMEAAMNGEGPLEQVVVFGKEIKLRSELTRREMEVLRLLHQGMPNKAIAHRLGISEGTVKIHIHNTFKKMNCTNRVHLVCMTQDLIKGEEDIPGETLSS
jgi:DNA-binding NarL/FixJ family response regulator